MSESTKRHLHFLANVAQTVAAQNGRAAHSLVAGATSTAATVATAGGAALGQLAKPANAAATAIQDANRDIQGQVGDFLHTLADERQHLLSNTQQDNDLVAETMQETTVSLLRVMATSRPGAEDPGRSTYQQSVDELNANAANVMRSVSARVPAILDFNEALWVAVQKMGNGVQGTIRHLYESLAEEPPDEHGR